jgi:hypothetical protein
MTAYVLEDFLWSIVPGVVGMLFFRNVVICLWILYNWPPVSVRNRRAVKLLQVAVAIWCWMGMVTYAQTPAFVHDPALDFINNNVALQTDIPRRQAETNLNQAHDLRTAIQTNNSEYGYQYRNQGNVTATVQGATATNETVLQSRLTNWVSNLASNFDMTGLGEPGTYASNYDGANNFSGDDSASIDIYSHALNDFDRRMGFMWDDEIRPILQTSSFAGAGFLVDAPTIVRSLIMLLAWLLFAVESMDYLQSRLSDIMSQRQVKGSTEAVLGTNASVVVGLSYAAVVTIMLGTLIGIVLTSPFYGVHLSHSGATVKEVMARVDDIVGNLPAWGVITSFFPITGLFLTWGYYVIFTRIVVWPLHMAVRAVIFWLTA